MEEITDITQKWKHWHFKNTGLLILSLILLIIFADTSFVKNFISWIGNLGYLGAFLAGMFFVSTFTVAPSMVLLFYLAETLNPFGIALAAGLGGMSGDYLIFRFLKDRVFDELKPVFINHGGKPLRKLFQTPYFGWAVPLLGAAIIASPIPDEVGIGLLGLSKIKTWQFVGLTFLLDAIGIFLIIMASKLL